MKLKIQIFVFFCVSFIFNLEVKSQTGIIFSSNSSSLGIRTRVDKRIVYEYKLSPSFQTSEVNSILQINDTTFLPQTDIRRNGRITFQPSALYIFQRNERSRIYGGVTAGITYNLTSSISELNKITTTVTDNFFSSNFGIQLGTEFTPFEKINKISFLFELIPTVNFSKSSNFSDEIPSNQFFSATILPRWGVIYYLNK